MTRPHTSDSAAPGTSFVNTRRWAWAQDALLALLCAFALWRGTQAVWGLQYPENIDLYRDIGAAQSIRDGAFGQDAAYLGETLWYNPLLPTLGAFVSLFASAPLNVVYTQLGPYVNILLPIVLYILLARFFRRIVGLLAAAALLFLDFYLESAVGWNAYTAAFVASRSSVPLFLLTLLAWRALLENGRWPYAALTGLLLGLTFLGHTAPALLFGTLLTLHLLWTLFWRKNVKNALRDYIVLVAAALLVSLPYTWSIVGHYGLRVLNNFPNSWTVPLLYPENFGALLQAQLNPLTALALVGLAALWAQPPQTRAPLYLWLLACLLWLVYSYAAQINSALPRVIPSLHFYFYLEILKFALAGVGLWALARLTARFATRRWKVLTHENAHMRPAYTLAALALAVLVAQGAPAFDSKRELRRPADQWTTDERIQMTDWIRANTPPEAVFLAPDGLDLPVVGPSGRKLVCIGIFWSNPYVDWLARDADRTALLGLITAGDTVGFRALAAPYQVQYVLLPAQQAVTLPALRLVFANSELALYAVTAAP